MAQSDITDHIETVSKINCTECGEFQTVHNNDAYAEEIFKENGWTIDEDTDMPICKDCKENKL